MVDYYAALGVPRDASEEVIKAAHRRLAREWHPDRNDHTEAAERFQEINEAKDVLLDPKRRADHDRRLDGSPVDDEWTPTIVTVDPEVIDFGVLKAGGAAAEAEIVLSWEGPAPGMVRPSSRAGDWWELFHVGVRGTDAIAFSVRAEAYDGLSGGRHTAQLDLMADADVYSVELAMTVAGGARSAAAASGSRSTTAGDWDDADDWGSVVMSPVARDLLAKVAAVRAVLPNGWLLLVVAIILIFGVLHVAWPFGHSAPRVIPQYVAQPTASAAASAKPKPTHLPLPQRASTAFHVRPGFRTSGTVTMTTGDMPAEQYRLTLTATAVGFTMVVRIHAAYDPRDDYYSGPDAAETVVVGPSCLDIAVQGDWPEQTQQQPITTKQEPALSTDLTESRGLVTGTMIFAAVLPGTYGFDLQCLGVTGRPDAPITIGRVTTPDVGVADGKFLDSQGYADYSAMAVFSVRQARHDTVLVFGQDGPTDSAKSPSAACVKLRSGRKLHPAATSVHVAGAGDGQAYTLGTQTYHVSGSQLSGADFFYNCAAGISQDYVRLS